jgi:2-methylaconitate cis-trans-isomerase PrpF
MIAHIAVAEGAPCPTLVLAADLLPTDDAELVEVLAQARTWLCDNGAEQVLKVAIVARSAHPLFDLDYRFVQCLPGRPPRFDLRGSCGHSILSSVLVASRLGWLPALAPEQRIRVNVLNNGDHVVCEVDTADRGSGSFTVHFVHNPSTRLGELLITGEPVTGLTYPGGGIRVSFVSAGNPYVFVDAADLGVTTSAGLFTGGAGLYDELAGIRRSAALHLGWDPDGAFPKVAALVADVPGRLSARALSVPSWHPTLALTGVGCLAAASAIGGTVPHRLARRAGCLPGQVAIDTAGGSTSAAAAVSGTTPGDTLNWISVSGKVARFTGQVFIEPLSSLAFRRVEACLPLPN